MQAEDLLRSLLDSRSQSTTIAEASVEPTRIQLLAVLRREPHSASELARELSISRQTVYRAFPACIESGLVREEDGQYTLTCAGAYLLRRYRRFTQYERIYILPKVARSKHRHWVLQTLSKQESRRATLNAIAKREPDSGPSRSTIYRVLNEFTQEGYLENSDGLYIISKEGAQFLREHDRLVRAIEGILTAKAFLRWLPAEFDDFPIEELEEADMVYNTYKQPHLCLNAFVEVADPELETFHGIGTIVSPALAQAYRPVFRGDGKVRLVFTDDVLFELHRDREFMQFLKDQGYGTFIKRGLYARNAEFRFVKGELPLHVAVCDEEQVVMAPAPSTGVIESETTGIVSTNPQVIGWALNYFEQLSSQGRSPLRAFLDCAVGRRRAA
jgi:predicted transcriptional regulator